MGISVVPCRDCSKHEAGCHAKCKKYLDWRIEHDKMLKQSHKERKAAYYVTPKSRKRKTTFLDQR